MHVLIILPIPLTQTPPTFNKKAERHQDSYIPIEHLRILLAAVLPLLEHSPAGCARCGGQVRSGTRIPASQR